MNCSKTKGQTRVEKVLEDLSKEEEEEAAVMAEPGIISADPETITTESETGTDLYCFK